MDYQQITFDDMNDYEDYLEFEKETSPEHSDEQKPQNIFAPLIKRSNEFNLLEPGYFEFRVINCNCCNLAETATRRGSPVARLKLEIINDEGNVVINHVLFINQYNNKEIYEFFSTIGLAVEDEFIPQWEKVKGRTGGCHIIQKKLDFKTVNAIDRFIPQN